MANRDRMVEAAAGLFASQGWAGTTMESVAAGSGMSVQSVYFAFHTKAALLRAALELATPDPGDNRPVDADPDATSTLAIRVASASRTLAATGPLLLAAAAAAPADGAAAAVLAQAEAARAETFRELLRDVRRKQPLRRGLTLRQATDVVAALLSPQLYALLVGDRGWSDERYVAWVTRTLERELWG